MNKDHDTQPSPGRYPGADPERREPETLFQPRPRSLEAFHAAARKAARLHLLQSEKGRRRAALGNHVVSAPTEHMREAKRRAPQCTAQKRDGTRCRAVVVRGSDRCVSHEGVQRNPSCPAAGRWYLQGKLKPSRGRFKTHPSALIAKGDRSKPD
ncbi:MAG: hypothetical protein LC676_17695 [Loktanella sp.]|nr:hypothetical protein [Loktanella sp.]